MMLDDNDDRSYIPKDLEVFNLLKHPIWVFDSERKAMFWANNAALKIWNADSLQSLLSRDFASDMSKSVELRQKETLAKISRNEIVQMQRTFYPLGSATTLGVTCSKIRIDGGRIAMLTETEIPDKNVFEESTLRGVEMLRNLPFSVSQFSIEGKLVYQNPEAVNVFGTSTFETISENTTETTSDRAQVLLVKRFVDEDLGKAAFRQLQAGDDFSAETQLHTQLGPRWFSVNLRSTRDPVTSENIILHTSWDISDIIKARSDTMQAAMKSEFIAVMAHEIRTPLHQIVGNVDLIAMSPLSNEQREFIQQVQSSTALLMSIINDLLDYSKLEFGHLLIESVHFPLAGLLQGCLSSVKLKAELKGLTLRTDLAHDLPSKLVGDPNRLRQILLNLLSNAVKFTEHGFVCLTVVCVESSEDSQTLRFEVTDTGIGIDPREQTLVFEKFRQTNASVSCHYGGTGLGLSICKSLAELMGGTIGLVSHVGNGTTMFFEMPFKLPVIKKESSECNEPATSFDEVKRLQLLVVEDNKINQKVLQKMLERLGHTVVVAENGLLALDKVRQGSYDLVLMDIQMPVMDGIECTQQIRGVLGLSKAKLPVIGLTASFQHCDLDYYQEIGMNECMGKPVRMDILKQAISSAMQRRAEMCFNQ